MPLLQGTSALHAACLQLGKRGCDGDTFPEIVKMLAAHGADVNAPLCHVSTQVCNECTGSLTSLSQKVRELHMCQDVKTMRMHSQIVYSYCRL